MTTEERHRLIQELIALSAYYQFKIEDSTLIMYANDLIDLSLKDVLQASKSWRMNPKNNRFPWPAQLRGIIFPEITDEDRANVAVSLIITAFTKYGYVSEQEAKQFIGELGWKVVQWQGGWTALCQRTHNDALPTLQAQWKSKAISFLKLAKAGQLELPPSLPNKQLSEAEKEILKISQPKDLNDF